MAYQIIEEYEALPPKPLVIVLYGDPGSYKTSLSFTAEAPLLFDFDKGVHRSVGRKATVKFNTWEDAQQFIKDGQLEQRGVKTLIVDTGGALLDDYLATFVVKQHTKNGRPGGGVSQQGFGAIKDSFNMFAADMMAREIDLVFICHASEKADGDNMRLRPKMTGGSYDILLAKADLVGHVSILNNKSVLNFNPTDRTVGKNCAEFPPMELPHYAAPAWQGYFERVIADAKEKINSMSDAQRAALDNVKRLSELILEAETDDACHDLFIEINELPPVFQAQVLPALQRRIAEIWDREYFETATSAAYLNTLFEPISELPAPLQPQVKKLLVATAKRKGFEFNGNKDAPAFLEPEPAPASKIKKLPTPAAEQAPTLELNPPA